MWTFKALMSMDTDKSPGNDDITKESYRKFWDVVKEPLCASILESFIAGEFSTSQKQAIIKSIEKKDRWPISLATYLTSKCRYETNLKGSS